MKDFADRTRSLIYTRPKPPGNGRTTDEFSSGKRAQTRTESKANGTKARKNAGGRPRKSERELFISASHRTERRRQAEMRAAARPQLENEDLKFWLAFRNGRQPTDRQCAGYQA